ncbi:MAG: helix-turn-helix transcriptional regulator, partial [Candidatus Velthaea sp.]
PLLLARVVQRMSFAAFYRQEFGESQDRGLEAARLFEELQSFRSAAAAYSVLYNIAFNYNGDVSMARFYAERVSVNGKLGGDDSAHTYGLVSQLHIAAESGERRRLGSIRARLLATQRHEQFRERFVFVLSEVLMAGWAGRFDSAAAAVRVLREEESRFRGDRALCDGLLAVAAAADWQLDEARTLLRRAISGSTQQVGHEAQYEARARMIARYLASAACYIIGDASRGVRALSRTFDPNGRFGASLSLEGVNVDLLPTAMRGYGLFIAAAFESARRLRPTHRLTQTELDILRVLPVGDTVARIALDRGTSKRTVERQVDNIYEKLGARNRTDAIRRARDLGILR